MIPPNISAEDILKGIKKIDKDGYPRVREADNYDLVFEGKHYPPKVVISYSNISANREELSSKFFNGGDESNNFLISRGFPIEVKETPNQEGFFTDLELHFLQHYANTPYDSRNVIHRNAAEFIKNVIWDKTYAWAKLISERLPFDIEGKRQWNQRGGKGQTSQRFKHYTWYKLHYKEINHPKIYYTVGVGADKTLVLKIDCQREGENALQPEQVKEIDDYLSVEGVRWREFKGHELQGLNWESLTNLSVAFIRETLPVYRELIAFTKDSVPEKCARICWNEHDWISPSGRYGKSVTSPSNGQAIRERDNGFVPEEWLLDIDKEIAGYHYGRLEPLHTERGKHIGKTYHLTLFAYNADKKLWCWIGRIENAEVITPEESARMAEEYRSNGWDRERIRQLEALEDIDAALYSRIPDKDLFNVRFQPGDFRSYDYAPFEEGESEPSGRYNLADKKADPGFFTASPEDGLDLIEREGRTPKKKISKRSSESYKEIDNIHGSIQTDIVEVFRGMYPDDRFYLEGRKRADHSRIDIVRVTPGGSRIFYEIKTYPNVMQSIRVAVGQLLEYAFYPEQALSTEFFIVTHLRALPVELRFLNHLSDRIGCRFGYIHFDWEAKRICQMG